MAQRAFILWYADDESTNLERLNELLEQGWTVAQVTPMSGTGERGNETPRSPFPYSRAVVILQR